jgi:putative ATPase
VSFVAFSAVLSGVKEVREAMERATVQRRRTGRPMLLFVDEIHRFNKAQQDAFLPYVERGIITFVGATTENPSFEVISALLSRASC